MKFGKRAAMGEGILMVYRILMVIIVALIVLGASSIFYDYYVDVRYAESTLISRRIVECIAPSSFVDFDFLNSSYSGDLLVDCGLGNLENIHVSLIIFNGSESREDVLGEFEGGNRGVSEIHSFFISSGVESTEAIREYRPGSYLMFPEDIGKIEILYEKNLIEGGIELYVQSKGEF